MITYTSLNHTSTLNNIAAAMQQAKSGKPAIVRNKKGKAILTVVFRGGVYKFIDFRKCRMISHTVKKALKSVDNARFNALSFLVA